MKKQLHLLRQLVQQAVTHSDNTTSIVTDSFAVNQAGDLLMIKDVMIDYLQNLSFSKKPEVFIKRKILHTQRECITLLDMLPRTKMATPDQVALADQMRKCLDELLRHLHQHNCYFSCEVNAPYIEIQRITDKTFQKMTVMKAALKRKKIYSELLNIICAAFDRFHLSQQHTYQHLQYMSALQLSILKLCEKASDLDFDYQLIEHLTYWCFNECHFVDYCKSLIKKALKPHYGTKQCYEQLCHFEKRLTVQQEKANLRYSVQRNSVKYQLMVFVQAELECIEKKQQYHSGGKGVTLKHTAQIGSYRVQTSFSVAALAYFMKLLCESGIIQAEPRSQLLAFIAHHFQTPRIGEQELSASSLATKYKQVTPRTAHAMKAKLKELCQRIDDDFGSGD
ncbi:hypothetical protein [Pedobacter frigidisoli]|uniref:hypothetical protein n=1 Tax=Pedobacter frigidisoli TaxID=2530455 RepID=UPI00293010F5|nr:hypothetical protein [Pedobacter frigidisoli]